LHTHNDKSRQHRFIAAAAAIAETKQENNKMERKQHDVAKRRSPPNDDDDDDDDLGRLIDVCVCLVCAYVTVGHHQHSNNKQQPKLQTIASSYEERARKTTKQQQ
jgi:hypothetical protein